ncbi:unnamed protein product [Sphagnum jensenii]|uniref:Major facilitator superfamily (MFS) profile domain-containing protein n=1 Tax=Sphagnum jensenii TaxID=128206 RepID=A0ABP1ATF2_9BRYO
MAMAEPTAAAMPTVHTATTMESSLLVDGGERSDINEQPRWFTPTRLLILFCLINMLNYLDRGVIASNGVNGAPGDPGCLEHEACFSGSGIQGDFKLSYFQDGVLSSAFMVGLVVASPIFANLSKKFNPFRLIGIGLSVWTFATAGCGFSVDFWSITSFRMLVGVGEASFISLAAPFIDDGAPPAQSSAWLALFYMCIPVGIALGYVFGGVVGGSLGWRSAFWIESLLMLPFAIFGFMSKRIHLKGATQVLHLPSYCTLLSRTFGVASEVKGLLDDCKKLAMNRLYVMNVLGYITFNFVLGAYAYWGPKAGQAIYSMENADLVFGVVTILSGILGTVVGGIFLDYLGSTIRNGFKLLAVSTALGATMCLFAFLSTSLAVFIPLFAIGEFFLFATQGPVNFVTLRCVTPVLRPLSMAMSTVVIHVFGDVPSAPIVGAFQDWLQNWRLTTLGLTCIFFLATAIWASGIAIAPRNGDRGIEVTPDLHQPGSKSQEAPLLTNE